MAARAGLGRGPRHGAGRAARRRPSSSSATASSRSTAFATRTSASSRGPWSASRASGRTAASGGRSARASARCRRCSPSPTTCSMPSRSRIGPTRFAYGESDRFPVDAAAACRGEPVARASWLRPMPRCAPSAWRARSTRCWHRDRCATRQTGLARAVRPGRHRHPVPVARGPPGVRVRARGARHRLLRLQGARLLRGRRDQGCRSRCCGTSRIPHSDLRAAAFLRSRFVRLSDRALAAARARGLPMPFVTPRRRTRRSTLEDEAVLAQARDGVRRVAAAGRPPAARGAARSHSGRVRLRVRDRGPSRRRRRART